MKTFCTIWVAIWLCLPAFAQTDEPWKQEGFDWGFLPAVNYNTDEGVGFGGIGSIYRYDGETTPYKWSLVVQAFATTRGIHAHMIEFDGLDLGGKGLRLSSRVRFESTRTDNYCGLGPAVTCDPAVAEAAADYRDLTGEKRDEFINQYYLNRFIYPHAWVNIRYPLKPMPHRIEFFGGYRFGWRIPGDFKTRAAVEGSQYARDFGKGEDGSIGVLQAGLMVDNRDFEPAPTRGYWTELSFRGAAPFLGSSWTFGGFNATFRGYVSLAPEGRLVLANRFVVDGLIGDAPTMELAGIGGSDFYTLMGGEYVLRGIRLRRFRGHWKVFNQLELRWLAGSWALKKTQLDLTVVTFVDVGQVASKASDFTQGPPLVGEGAGIRFAFDKTFMIRVDVGVSHVEGWDPGVYFGLKNLF